MSPMTLKDGGNTTHEIGPMLARRTGQGVERQIDSLAELFRPNVQRAIVSRTAGDPGVETDGRGHDETVVVIGVLSNEVHAPGCAKNGGACAVRALEFCLQGLCSRFVAGWR